MLRFVSFSEEKTEAQTVQVALNRKNSCFDYCNRIHVLGTDRTVVAGLKKRNCIGVEETMLTDDDQHCLRREVDHRRVASMKHRL